MIKKGEKIKIGGTPISPGTSQSVVDWQAQWLRDPIFEGVERREFIDPGRKEENNGEVRNIHTLFRKEITIDDNQIKQARLYITADDCYKLYINGDFIGLGPAPAYPSDFPYNAWDVTEFLIHGDANCIGVHTFYHGMHSLTFPSGDNLQGMILQLETESEGDENLTFVSDASWKCIQTDAYECSHVLGYQTAFSEDIDLRKLPVDWSKASYDDSFWQLPLSCNIPEYYTLSPQATPPVSVFKRIPEKVIKKGEGHYFIDFGSEMSGETAFVVNGKPGHKVEIRHGEELSGPETVRYDMRCNCLYQESCTLSGKTDELLTFFDYKGFRYVEVLNWPEELTEDRVWAHERHYPFPEDASCFSSSNPLLNDIWELCRNGVRVGTIDTFLDCPTREKGGFLGDGFVTGISHLILTGDGRILRKFLKDVADTAFMCPGLSSTAPNYINGILAEYSLLWPVLLEHYYCWTGDLEFVNEMMPVLEGMLKYFAEFENEDGLLQDLYSHETGRYSILVDWPKNLRDEYDDPYLMGDRKIDEDPKGVVNTMVQGFYYQALKTSERLADITDTKFVKEHASSRLVRISSSIAEQLQNSETGLFIDRNGSTHSALHSNVTPLMSGVLSPDEAQPVIDLIRDKRLSCGVYFSFFVLKSLYDIGEPQLAYDIMTSKDLHSWNSMLEAGATTCMEAWAPDLKWNTSWCHPWSSAPIHMIAQNLMGLKPLKPGWEEISFAPRLPRDLESASIRFKTPKGNIKVSFKQDDKSVEYVLKVPNNCTVKCSFESTIKKVIVEGAETPIMTANTEYGVPCILLEDELPGGEYVIRTIKSLVPQLMNKLAISENIFDEHVFPKS